MALRNLSRAKLDDAWVPTLTPVLNVDDVTLLSARYAIVGDLCMCFVAFTRDPTGTGLYQIGCSLPFGVQIDGLADIAGSGGDDSTLPFAISVSGDATNNRALIAGNFGADLVNTATIFFAYRVKD